jgi:hypothetical protein
MFLAKIKRMVNAKRIMEINQNRLIHGHDGSLSVRPPTEAEAAEIAFLEWQAVGKDVSVLKEWR